MILTRSFWQFISASYNETEVVTDRFFCIVIQKRWLFEREKDRDLVKYISCWLDVEMWLLHWNVEVDERKPSVKRLEKSCTHHQREVFIGRSIYNIFMKKIKVQKKDKFSRIGTDSFLGSMPMYSTVALITTETYIFI